MCCRLIVAIIAVSISSLSVLAEDATLKLTTDARLGPDGRIIPSSATFDLGTLSPTTPTFIQLRNVLYTIVNGNDHTQGTIALDFDLAIGSENVLRSAIYKYDVFSQISGAGAHGGTASLSLSPIVPIVFGSEQGTLTIVYSSVSVNQLGQPQGSSSYAPLDVALLFSRVPEPPSCTLLFLGLVIAWHTQRHRRE